jgi:hypothetical protein
VYPQSHDIDIFFSFASPSSQTSPLTHCIPHSLSERERERESARKGLLNRRVFWRQELFLHLSPSIAVGADFFSSVFACASPKRGTGTRPSKQKSCYRITATAQFDLSVDSNPIAHHGRDRKGARERGVSSTTSC